MCLTLIPGPELWPRSVPNPRPSRPGQHRHKPKCPKAQWGGERRGRGAGGTGESDLPFIYENALITSMMMELQPV